jgi:MYXO-CTERM domain-containing protein
MLSRGHWRGIQVSPVLVASLAVLGGCSSEAPSGPESRTVATAVDGEGAARARLASIRDQVTMPRDLAPHAAALPIEPSDPAAQLAAEVPVIGPGIASRFEAQPSGGTIPIFEDAARRERRTRVELPSNASQPVLLNDPESGVGISFALEGAQPARRHEVDGIAMYLGVTQDGADVAQRAHAGGVEDYVYFAKRPSRSAVRYQVDVSKVPGLRFVENVLEFLDAKGDPRLRMKAPYMVGADGETHQPRVSVEGCAHDTSPAAPWDRAITPPGSDSCLITVAWDDAKTRYPAVLDPGWEATASMTTARMKFTMTNISSNRLLIAGGATTATMATVTATAEIYNPSSDTFAVADSMDVPRAAHAATVAATGNVVVFGGSTTSNVCLDSAEVWNGSTWSTLVSKMKTPRRYHTATLLSDYRILVVGGLTNPSCETPTSSSELYNSLTNTFASTPPSLKAGARAFHTATWVPFGAERVLVAGGVNATGAAYGAAEVFTVSTSAFSTTASSAPRMRHVAAVTTRTGNCLGDCRVVMLAGGQTSALAPHFTTGTAVDTIEYWDTYGNFYNATAKLASARESFAAAVVDGPTATDAVLFMGGRSGTTYRSDSSIVRTHLIDTFRTLDAGSLGSTRAYHQAATVSYAGGSDNAAIVCGGYNGSSVLSSCQRFVLQADGATCNAVGQCNSTLCVDGVCCATPCTATPCMACSAEKTGGTSGVCAPVAEGTDLDGECALEAPTSCGQTGFCSGAVAGSASSCQLYPDTTICVEQHCTTSTTLGWTRCNGTGDCTLTETANCTPYGCVEVTGPDACGETCSDESDCAAGQFCNGGVCIEKVVQGGECDPAKVGQCLGGLPCVDGVCCESTCGALCYACSQAKTGQANGLCRGVLAGDDPDLECTQSPETSCGDDGTCNGSGACRKWDNTTFCGTACQSDNAYVKHCNGGGSCIQDSSVATYCSPFKCDLATGTCLTSCVTDADCQAGTTGRYCQDGACLDKKPLGEICAAAKECFSAFCVDSVCCNNGCTGLCRACSAFRKGGGNDGTCEPVYPQKDPSDECDNNGPCLENGYCNGLGACGLYAVGTSCGSTQCVGTIATGQMCDGSGACINNTTGTECSPYVCQTGVGCLTSCAGDQDCVTGTFCNSLSQCVPKLANGQPCTAATQCGSNHCVDQVCCNQACGSLCFACTNAKKGGGQDGDCAEIETGADPDNDCEDEGACGLDGTCNGLGGCRLYASGSPCGTGAVCDGTIAKGQMCNGTGTCVDQPSGTECSPHVCKANVGCAKPCVSAADCIAGHYCAISGDCLPRKSDSSPCAENYECSSTFCVDGVCCNTACSDPCQACSASAKQTGADGLCGPAREGTDPHDDCVENPPASCSYDGQCNGTGACRLYIQGTACGPTLCDGNLVKGQTCNGSGTCVNDPTGTDCAPYVCEDSVCLTSCVDANDCTAGNLCVDDACTTPGQLGSPCTGGTQCGSGWCVDGVCCNEECESQCEACSVAGSVGICAPVSGSPLGSREPCDGTAPCKGACDGVEATACSYPGSAVICASSCADATASVAACDGAGQCGTAQDKPCAPYICEDENTCKLSCEDSNDCVAPAECDATGHCVEPGADSGTGGSSGMGGSGGSGGTAGTGGSTTDAGSEAGPATPPATATSESGCGCRVPTKGSDGRWAIVALLAGLAALRRRRSL